jgi:rhodanese-related sulfurtransferase
MKKLLVINVLDESMYKDCHIPGSINVPLEKVPEFVADLDKQTPIVVYCANYLCSASRHAWMQLNQLGFKHVWAYEGGVAEWKQKGYPTQGDCTQAYLKSDVRKSEQQESMIRQISAEELKKMMYA